MTLVLFTPTSARCATALVGILRMGTGMPITFEVGTVVVVAGTVVVVAGTVVAGTVVAGTVVPGTVVTGGELLNGTFTGEEAQPVPSPN